VRFVGVPTEERKTSAYIHKGSKKAMSNASKAGFPKPLLQIWNMSPVQKVFQQDLLSCLPLKESLPELPRTSASA